MSQQALSPLMQVTQTPSVVISHMHMPMVRLQQQTMAPFIMQQRLHFELAIIEQRFCSMLQAILSSHEQVIFIPPVHFSSFILQRGIIIPVIAGLMVGIVVPIPDIIVVAGFMVAVVMADTPWLPLGPGSGPPWSPRSERDAPASNALACPDCRLHPTPTLRCGLSAKALRPGLRYPPLGATLASRRSFDPVSGT